ncbi:MAG: hypothetical protein Q8Q90_00495 [bacterium]|nr:hypothetical protein [bacterium]
MSKEIEKISRRWRARRVKLRKRKGGKGKARYRRTTSRNLFSEDQVRQLTGTSRNSGR